MSNDDSASRAIAILAAERDRLAADLKDAFSSYDRLRERHKQEVAALEDTCRQREADRDRLAAALATQGDIAAAQARIGISQEQIILDLQAELAQARAALQRIHDENYDLTILEIMGIAKKALARTAPSARRALDDLHQIDHEDNAEGKQS